MKEITIKRGEIYNYDFGNDSGSLLNGKLPVFILQAKYIGWQSPTVLAAPIIPTVEKRRSYSNVVLNSECGLESTSVVLMEQITPIKMDGLQERVGALSDKETWNEINSITRKLLGLYDNRPRQSTEVCCLCRRCLKKKLNDPDIVVRRADLSNITKSKCSNCSNTGYEYIITHKSKKQKGQ